MNASTKRKWIAFFSVLLGVLLVGEIAGRLLIAQGSPAPGLWVRRAAWLIGNLWVLWSLYRVRQFRYAKELLTLAVGSNIIGLTGWLLYFQTDYKGTAIAITGTWAMVCTFVIGLWLIRLVLTPSNPVTAVARTCVDEAIRMKVALVFIIGLMLMVPLLPFALDGAEQLRYRVQFFMTWSLIGTGILLGLLTVFLACATICNEIGQRQIYMTMVKPISRAQYLLGKWLGISVLNLLLVVIAGGTTYVMVRMLQQQPAASQLDRVGVDEELLTARVTIMPSPPEGMDLAGQYHERIAALKRENPDVFGGRDQPPPQAQREIESLVLAQWHTIAPQEERQFVFEGLNEAKTYAGEDRKFVQLRFKPDVRPRPDDLMVRFTLRLNGREFPMHPQTRQHMTIKSAVKEFNSINVPLQAVDENGRLVVGISNIDLLEPEKSHTESIVFAPNEGIELLYDVGSFEMNLARAVFILWLRLVFLAILGLMAGTFLGFPVASLFSMFMYGVAVSSSYLMYSLSWFGTTSFRKMPFGERIVALFTYFIESATGGHFKKSAELGLRIFCELFVLLIPSFSTQDPLVDVSDGRLVSYATVGDAVIWLGLVWSGGFAFIAWFVFRRRELARVIV